MSSAEHAKTVEEIAERIKQREHRQKEAENAAEQLVADCQAVFGTEAGQRVLAYLEASYLLRKVDLADFEGLTMEQQAEIINRRIGRAEVVRCLKGALAGKARGCAE